MSYANTPRIHNYLRLWIVLKAFGTYTYKNRITSTESAQSTKPSEELLNVIQAIHIGKAPTEEEMAMKDVLHDVYSSHQPSATVGNAEIPMNDVEDTLTAKDPVDIAEHTPAVQTAADISASASPPPPTATIVDDNTSSRPVRSIRKPMVTYRAILNG